MLYLIIEEYHRIFLPWSCEFCTFDNRSYIETFRDTCEMCESPSPLKRGRQDLG